jgi:hypothetical protein
VRLRSGRDDVLSTPTLGLVTLTLIAVSYAGAAASLPLAQIHEIKKRVRNAGKKSLSRTQLETKRGQKAKPSKQFEEDFSILIPQAPKVQNQTWAILSICRIS